MVKQDESSNQMLFFKFVKLVCDLWRGVFEMHCVRTSLRSRSLNCNAAAAGLKKKERISI